MRVSGGGTESDTPDSGAVDVLVLVLSQDVPTNSRGFIPLVKTKLGADTVIYVSEDFSHAGRGQLRKRSSKRER